MITIRTAGLMSPADVARRLNLSAARILQLARSGSLASIKVSGGWNVFTAEVVEQFAHQRECAQAARLRNTRRAQKTSTEKL